MTGFEPAIALILIGLGILAAGAAPLERLHGAMKAALGFLFGLYAVTLTLMIAANVTGHFYPALVWAMALAAAGAIVWRRRAWMARLERMRGGLKIAADGKTLLIAGLAAATLYNAWLVADMALRFPTIGYDAISNYMLKAALWFDTRELFPAKLMDPEYVMYHRRYPPALSVAEMIWFHMMGGIDIVRVKGLFLASWMLGGAAVFALLRRDNGAVVAWTGAAVWMMLPYHLMEYQGGAVDGYPDLPLILANLGALALAREFGREKALAPAALMAFGVAGAVLIKQDGLIFSFFLTLVLLLRRAPLRNIALIGAFTALNIIVWKASGRGVPSHLDESYFSINTHFGKIIERLGILIAYAGKVFSDETQWGAGFLLLGIVWVFKLLFVPWRNWASPELGLGAALTATYIAVLINTPLDIHLHLESTTDRLFLHSYPLYVIATFDKLESARPLKECALVRIFRSGRAPRPAPAVTPDHA